MFVLPAPVGAHTKRFSGDLKAAGYNLLYIKLSLGIDSGNAFYAQLGKSDIGISLRSESAKLCYLTAGTKISS